MLQALIISIIALIIFAVMSKKMPVTAMLCVAFLSFWGCTYVFTSCESMPQRIEIDTPTPPQMPSVDVQKTDGGVFIPEQDFILLVQYIEKMKGYGKELNAVIDYYKE